MDRKNLLRMAVESRRQHLIRRLLTLDAYTHSESQLSSLSLSELEEEWRHYGKLRKDEIS